MRVIIWISNFQVEDLYLFPFPFLYPFYPFSSYNTNKTLSQFLPSNKYKKYYLNIILLWQNKLFKPFDKFHAGIKNNLSDLKHTTSFSSLHN